MSAALDIAALAAGTGSALLGGVLAAAGVAKLAEPRAFRAAVAGYGLTSPGVTRRVAETLPWVEIAAGAALAAGLGGGWSAGPAAGLLLLFAGAMAATRLRGRRDIDCGCRFGGRRTVSWALAAQTLALGATAAVLALGSAGLGLGERAQAAAAAALIGLVFLSIRALRDASAALVRHDLGAS